MKKDDYISYKPDLEAITSDAEEQLEQWKIEIVDPDDVAGTMHNMDVYLMAAIYYLEDYIATSKALAKAEPEEKFPPKERMN